MQDLEKRWLTVRNSFLPVWKGRSVIVASTMAMAFNNQKTKISPRVNCLGPWCCIQVDIWGNIYVFVCCFMGLNMPLQVYDHLYLKYYEKFRDLGMIKERPPDMYSGLAKDYYNKNADILIELRKILNSDYYWKLKYYNTPEKYRQIEYIIILFNAF